MPTPPPTPTPRASQTNVVATLSRYVRTGPHPDTAPASARNRAHTPPPAPTASPTPARPPPPRAGTPGPAPQPEPRGGEDDPAEQPAAGEPRRPQLQRPFRVLGRRPELLQIPVAVAELVGQLGLVEEPRPVRHLVAGPRRVQRAFRADQRGRAGPYLPEHPVPARLGGVQQGLDGGRGGAAHALLGDPGELHGLASVAEVDGLAAHGDQHVRAVRPVAGRLCQPQRLDEVPLGEPVRGDVERGPARPAGSGRPRRRRAGGPSARRRCRAASAPARAPGTARGPGGRARRRTRRRGCGTARRRSAAPRCRPGDPVAGRAVGRPAPAGGDLGGRHGPYRRAALGGHPDRLGAGDLLVGPSDQPVAAGHHEPRRGERDLPQLGVAAGVLAPQPADDVDGLLGVAANSSPA